MSRVRSRKPQPGTPSTGGIPPSPPARPDRRRFIYAGFDLGLAGLHGLLAGSLAPPEHAAGKLLLWGIVAAFLVAAAGTLAGRRAGWWSTAGALGALLVLEVVLLAVILASASYLAGVFGAFGVGAAGIALAVAALSIQTVALVPALQLKYVMTRAGRRAFGVAPS
jgi:hypothetical protein